ncbi:ThiF family adenylyltransferase [Roseisolibacter agri]|uniref:ThiF family adenylyltransferase n=1 Tax=Roseisolibacter agri TaxID=2014610 RepID=A0AA37Q7P2_9BACT|nr:ThiF family adenylyltransferase [Roseisolibacter agri]GLC27774.1 hypothetical protein rosag_42870 [Roseisolibacter agri]
MSQRLISRSPDLRRLRDDGYAIEVRAGFLLVHDVPYLSVGRVIQRGVLVSALDLADDATVRPSTHVVYFAGAHPCNLDGSPITQIEHGSGESTLAPGIVVHRSFSNKPGAGYQDYYEKMTRYAAIISHPAQAIDPAATPRTFRVVEADDAESPFEYVDTATSRAGIGAFAESLHGQRIAVVGLGGTGSYVLDLVAKTPVEEIHLYDRDSFSQHNAFRSPGAASVEDLRRQLDKATYFQQQYARMKRGVIAHSYYLDATNVDELREMDFVFLCVDNGDVRRQLVESLEAFGVPFADVGMGVYASERGLGGVLRVTSSTQRRRAHVLDGRRIPFAGDDGNNEYVRNIQIADLNALNAALAVLKWKKHLGFYLDFEKEHHTTYTIDGNTLTNEECA